MSRRLLAVAVLSVVPLTGMPVASAAPAPAPEAAAELCVADPSRGAVPTAFPLRACVDGSGMTLLNDREHAVVITGVGDLRAPVRLRAENDVVAVVVRSTVDDGAVLLPGEVARWPIGAGAAFLTVRPLPVPAAPEIAGALSAALPRGADEEPPEAAAVAAVIGQVGTALRARATCAEGRNFLGTTACDVDAAVAIGAATADLLDRRATGRVLPLLLEPASWAAWTAVAVDLPAGTAVTMGQLAVPPPPAAVAPPAAASGSAARAVSAPAPAGPPAAAPAPSPPVAASPGPAARPAPQARPAQPQVRAPSRQQQARDRAVERIREIAAAWEQARQREQAREREQERGRGRDRVHHHGRGHR